MESIFEQLLVRSYEAIKARGLIKEDTKCIEFVEKILEEFYEVEDVWQNDPFDESRYIEELTDLATVCLMQVMHLGYNPIKEFEKVVIKNETRKD